MNRHNNYTNLVILENEISNLATANEYLFKNVELANLLIFPCKYCYKYIDDEDIAYKKFTISEEKMSKLNQLYDCINEKDTLEGHFKNMNLTNELYYIHPSNYNIFCKMWKIVKRLTKYYEKNELIYISNNIIKNICEIITAVAEEINLNPSADNHNILTDIQYEYLICINLCMKYIKIIMWWCHFNGVNWTEFPKKELCLNLINNYLMLIFEICF